MSLAPPLGRVLETCLYVADMDRSRDFYEGVMGLVPMVRDARLTAYPAGPASVLLLFQRGGTAGPASTPGGVIPGHDGSGRLHYAFSIAVDTLQDWRLHLAARGISLESEVNWPRGGCSLYFRDPDEHLVELATPGLWNNY